MNHLLFDTCFLIDIERELRRGGGKAHDFLVRHPNARPWISWTVAGAFAEGFGSIQDPVCAAMLGKFDILEMNEATAGCYARITADLRRKSLLIGANDLWIAAASLAAGYPLVTNNSAHFRRVPGLKWVDY
jgi:predicted nucleic acid-binding protein